MGDFKVRFFLFAFSLVAACALAAAASPEAEAVDQAARQLEAYLKMAPNQSPEFESKVRAELDKLRFIHRLMTSEGDFRSMFQDRLLKNVREFEKSAAAAAMLTDGERGQLRDYIVGLEGAKSLADLGEIPVPALLTGEDDAEAVAVGAEAMKVVKRGDLLFRKSNGVGAGIFYRSSLREKRFTHVGIALGDGSGARLADFSSEAPGDNLKVSKKDMAEFLEDVDDLAVYRYVGPEAESVRERIAQAAEKRLGTPFDPAFDLMGKERLYCTEMVRDCVNEAAGHEVIGTSRKGDFEYVAVDDCYRKEMAKVWDCRDQKPEEKQPIQKLQSRPVVIKSSSTTNAPVRRIIRFVPRK